MPPVFDKFAVVVDDTEPPSADLLAELRWIWRAAIDDEEEAWHAWRSGEGSHGAFLAALDREQAAADALELYHGRLVARPR
jgi:hypothetical protein